MRSTLKQLHAPKFVVAYSDHAAATAAIACLSKILNSSLQNEQPWVRKSSSLGSSSTQ